MRCFALTILAAALAAGSAVAQKPPEKKDSAKAQAGKQPPQEAARPEFETALEQAIERAGNDRAALVRNLEEYLANYPETPRRIQVYRALVEAAMQLRDLARALEYAERIIALRPDDSAMMLFTVDLLERQGDDISLTKAVGYVSRVLDRVQKSAITEPPERVASAEWQLEQKKLEMSVYLVRGRLEMRRRRYDRAVADLEASYRALPNPAAAMRLGEIAELRKDYAKAIEYYTTAFVLPENYGAAVNGREIRSKLGNVWRLLNGSDAGLGEHLLTAYDHLPERVPGNPAAERNRGANELTAFVLRRLDASEQKLADYRGKVLVMHFWTTWCVPCRELEPLFEQVRRKFEGNAEVTFLAVNQDEDESQVRPYVEREKMATPMVFADGLDRFLVVDVIPTVIVLDRAGKIVYRVPGFDPERFTESLTEAINRALAGAN
jgi:thiol-disulfide isomerase/thioredoxin